jgi:hypothetical protein
MADQERLRHSLQCQKAQPDRIALPESVRRERKVAALMNAKSGLLALAFGVIGGLLAIHRWISLLRRIAGDGRKGYACDACK